MLTERSPTCDKESGTHQPVTSKPSNRFDATGQNLIHSIIGAVLLRHDTRRLDQRIMKQIPPFRLKKEPLTEEAAELLPFKWADRDIGTRHRLGGEPSFVQAADYPACSNCDETMTFYGQLDSINDEYTLADVGLVFVFVCFDCFTSTSFIQSA